MARSLKAYTDDYLKLAEAGGTAAQLQLGLLHSTGQKGAPLDYVAAHKWLNLAALRGNDEAKRLRSELAGVMSRKEISEAQRQAREWISTHQSGKSGSHIASNPSGIAGIPITGLISRPAVSRNTASDTYLRHAQSH